MHSTLNPKQADGPHDLLVVAPDVVLVVPTDEELSNLAQEAARHPWDPKTGDPQTHAGSDSPAGPAVPPVDTTFRPAVNDVLLSGHQRSIGGQAVRGLTVLLLAACIGGAAVAWQSSGDAVQRIIAKWAPQFVLTSSLPPENPGLPAQPAPPADRAAATKAAAPQPAPPPHTAPEAVASAAALSAESAQSLPSVTRDLATVGQEIEQLKASIEQLKANQQQMARDVANASEVKASEVKASEQNLRRRISALPPRSAAARVRKPMPPLPPPMAAAAPALPQATVPSVPLQPAPQSQATVRAQDEPVLRPPMPLR